MLPKRRYSPRARRTPGQTLLRFLIAHGGSATLWQISRATATGKLFAAAKPELDGLIVTEQSRGKVSKRPITRVCLTLAGLAAAQALRPDWTPRRLATPVLKAWFNELASERDPWAMGILRDAADAREWRAHEAKIKRHEIVCGKPKPKARPRGKPYIAQGVHGPSTLDRKPIPPSRQAFGPTPTVQAGGHIPYSPEEISGQPTPTDWRCRLCGYCRRCTLNAEFCQCGKVLHFCGGSPVTSIYSQTPIAVQPTAQDAPTDSGLAAKIRKAGFQTNDSGRVLYDGRWIPADEWCKRMPHVRL
jgi:hypothetical protein